MGTLRGPDGVWLESDKDQGRCLVFEVFGPEMGEVEYRASNKAVGDFPAST